MRGQTLRTREAGSRVTRDDTWGPARIYIDDETNKAWRPLTPRRRDERPATPDRNEDEQRRA